MNKDELETNKIYEENLNEKEIKENKSNEEKNVKSKKPKKSFLKKTFHVIFDWIIALIIAVVILFVINFFIMQGKVSGESMMTTYHDGERLLINKRAKNLNVNDVIIFWADKGTEEVQNYTPGKFTKIQQIWLGQKDLEHKEFHIKRIVGVPGDKVEIKNNYVYVNDVEIGGSEVIPVEDTIYNLGTGEYFVMGDNYDNSLDSRSHGPIKEEDIYGKVINEKDNANTAGFAF